MPKILSRREAAETLGISEDTLDALRKEGLIAYIQHKPHGKVWITEEAIRDYLARATHPAVPVRQVRETYRQIRAV